MHRYVFILLFALLSSFRIQQSNQADKLIMKAAEGQLPLFIAKINPESGNLYGFTLDDDMDDCTIGKPYRILVFNNDFYTNPLDEEKKYIVIKSEWRAPVMIKGVNRNLLTVTGTSGNFVVTAMGDTTLAKDLQFKSKGAGEDETYYLLQIPELSADFFVHEADNSFNEAKFVPLASALSSIPALNAGAKPYYTLSETEQLVKQALTKEPAVPKEEKPKSPGKKK